MGGPEAIRGFLLQALICLLESLDSGWEYVIVEPDEQQEKVDLLWVGAITRAVQVKSSQNQITAAMVQRWANELATTKSGAEHLELVLLGPCSKDVTQIREAAGVVVVPPQPINIPHMLERGAHRLDCLLWDSAAPPLDPRLRMDLCKSLTFSLLEFAVKRQPLTWQQLRDRISDFRARVYAADRSVPNADVVVGAPTAKHSIFCKAVVETAGGTAIVESTRCIMQSRHHAEHYDYSITFDVTNRGLLPARISDIVVRVMSWRPASDVVNYHPQGALGDIRKYWCAIEPDKRDYPASFALQGKTLLIGPVEIECIELAINTATPGYYSFSIFVIMSANGRNREMPVGTFHDVLFVGPTA
jgi:hypothetical protein